jgi:hypothetical protein
VLAALKYEARAMPKYLNPTSSFRLLVFLQHGQPPLVQMGPQGVLHIPSISKIAKTLSTESHWINKRLLWLESQGYLTALQYSENKHQASFRLSRPRNIPSL